MIGAGDVVFLLDVDNTLLDNDRFAQALDARLAQSFGTAERDRYWAIFEQLRAEFGVADYLASLQSFRRGLDDHPQLLRMSEFLLEFPFASLLYAGALEAVAHLGTLGTTAVLSDGDVIFQPRKIQRAGIWDAVEGRVMIYTHKERSLAQVESRYPAAHYVMIDDKAALLAAMKPLLGARLTTVYVRQGHYAAAAGAAAIRPPPDRSIAGIGALRDTALSDF